MPRQAASYLRVSTSAQTKDDRWGYARQRQEVIQYAEAANLELTAEYKDAVSGTTTSRTGLTALKSAGHNLVVIPSIDRLARDVGASYKVLAELVESGFEVHSSDFGLIDLSDDMSLIQFNFRSLFATLEHRKIAARVRAAHLHMAESGKLPTGIKTYGYRGLDGHAIIDPVQAAVVRRIFELSAGGLSLFAIQNTLNDEGVPVARPAQSKQAGTPLWHRTVIGKLIKNPAYKGEHRWGKYPLSVPPIVSAELWQKAQKGKRGAYPSSGWPLVGHIRCGVCGRRMQSRRNRKTQRRSPAVYERYRCQSQSLPSGSCGAPDIERAWLEREAEALVRAALTDPDTLRQLLDDHAPPDTRAEAELAALAEEDARWLEAFRLGAITPAELGEYRTDLEKRRRALTVRPATEYPLAAYAAAAREMPFAELLDVASIVVVATRERLRLTLE